MMQCPGFRGFQGGLVLGSIYLGTDIGVRVASSLVRGFKSWYSSR
jgi:hypothetical protein